MSRNVPLHWFLEGNAPRFSRLVARRSADVDMAEQRLAEALRREYPEGCRVQVFHSRGAFFGHVDGWDFRGARVRVRNEHTGKSSKWWAAQVQRAS